MHRSSGRAVDERRDRAGFDQVPHDNQAPWAVPPAQRRVHVTNESEQYLRTADVARLLRVSPETVTHWAAEGKLPFSRTLGGHRRFPAGPIRRLVLDLEASSVTVDEILRRLNGNG